MATESLNAWRDRPVGLIGLGLVGTSLARRWVDMGAKVFGFDIAQERCQELTERGVDIRTSPKAMADDTDLLVLSLPDSSVVRTVVQGTDGILASGREGRLIVDTTTGDPSVTTEVAETVQHSGNAYVDACIIGSSKQVAEGDTIVVAGGSEPDRARCTWLLESFAKRVFWMGAAGTGCEAKLVVNLVLGLNRLVLGEGLVLADALGLDMERILELLKSGAAYSRAMDIKGEKMLARDFRPQAKLAQHLKDVRLILELGRSVDTQLPVSELHRTVLEAGVAAGLGELDNSAVLEVLRRKLIDGVHDTEV